MADLSDVTFYLYQQAIAAVYPNGTAQPSVANMDVIVGEGWPIASQLDLEIAGNMLNGSGATVARPGGPAANVSIYPMLGTGVQVYQLLDQTYEISPAVIAMGVSINGNVITVTGQPATGEYLTVIVDEVNVYSSNAATAAAILAAIATAAQAQYPSASSTATTLTIPANYSIVARQGGVATMGKVTHRQKHSVMVTVWAPNRVVRNQLAGAIDNLIKQTNKISLPDTSQAIVVYNRTMVSDEQQASTIYRRDLIYDVEYATVQEFPGYTITSVTTSIINMVSANTIAVAVAGGEDESLEPSFGFDFSDPDDSQYIPTT